MTCNPPPFHYLIMREADAIGPTRRRSSDGCCADARHVAGGTSDHIPDGRGVPHATDVSRDPPRYDDRAWANIIAARIATGRENRITYIVTGTATGDVIFHYKWSWPAMRSIWQWSYKGGWEHAIHTHYSYTQAAENDLRPFHVLEDEVLNDDDRRFVIDTVDARIDDLGKGPADDHGVRPFTGLPDQIHSVVREELEPIKHALSVIAKKIK